MKWNEFSALLSGIGPETSLGRIVSIRSETDKEALKNYTPEMRRIRAEWLGKQAKDKSEAETAAFLEQMKQAFISMSGGDSSGE